MTIDVAPFVRLDLVDEKRTHADLREASISISDGNFDIRIGVSKVYWGVTESRKLVDIVNQSDLVEEPKGDAKLGQPMVMLRASTGDVEASGYILPTFRERTFPGSDGRLRTSIPVASDEATYESPSKSQHIDFAARLKGRLDEVDFGLTYFSGTSREPRFEFNGHALVPIYDVIDQVGVDIQATLGTTLLKLEAISRHGHQGVDARNFGAVVVGFEHTIGGFAEYIWDLGLIAEYNWDDRPRSAPPTIFDRDVFLGLRMQFNDASDSSILAGLLLDTTKNSVYARIEGSTRIRDNLRLEIEGAFVLDVDPLDYVLRQIKDDAFLTIRLLQYL